MVVIQDLDMHVLECTPLSPSPQATVTTPLVLLLHGFPELSYSWRKVIQPIADAGYHVVAPDQRGYGLTKLRTALPSDRIRFTDDLSPFRMLNLVKDIICLVHTLGHTSVAAVVGHDFGSLVAGFCALIRPDLFKSVVMMSAPFPGPPSLQLDSPTNPTVAFMSRVADELAALNPPRKHYTQYFSTPDANADMCTPPSGLSAFLRTYYHVKSADMAHVTPYSLPSATAAVAVLPHYYIMPLHATMPQTIYASAPPDTDVSKHWLPDAELDVYVSEYSRTGFQGGLNWYRCLTDEQSLNTLQVFAGKKITVAAMFVAGSEDWGVYQSPGAAELMRDTLCEKMAQEDFVLVSRAGHWVQQEAPGAVVENLLRFLKKQLVP